MSLTSHIASKRSAVRAFVDRELGEAKPVCQAGNAVLRGGRAGGPPLAPLAAADPGLVGLATEFVFAAAGGAVRVPHIASAPTPELLDRRTAASDFALAELRRLNAGAPLAGRALERAADCALVCARLEQRFRMGEAYARRMGYTDPAAGVPEGLEGVIRATNAREETRSDLVALLRASIADTADLYRGREVYVNPVFALSVALGGADTDLIADGLLIDFKASKDRSVVRSHAIYQLVGYALADLHDWYGIRAVGIQALRWRTRWTVSLDDLLQRLSGTVRTLTEWRERFANVFPKRQRALAMSFSAPPRYFTPAGAVPSRARPRVSPSESHRRSSPSTGDPSGPTVKATATNRAASGRSFSSAVASRPPQSSEGVNMAAFVDSTVQDIDNRLSELKVELSRLEAARAALTGTGRERRDGTRRRGRPRTASAATATAPSVRPATRRPPGARRGGRRATRASQALELVRGQPGITIPELAKAMKIHPNYLYRVLPKLAADGQVKRAGKGWHPAS